ncbi:MAG: aspartate kinase [Microgenomates group bacterium]|jgi:hypothetical protein
MITVPEIVEEMIKQTPFLEEGLSLGIIDLSSLARKFQPEIQKKLYKDIQIGAIVMALKRLSSTLKIKQQKSNPLFAGLDNMTVRSNLIEYSFENSPTLSEKEIELLSCVDKEKDGFLTFTHGVFETTLIISSIFTKEVERIYKGETLRLKLNNLSAITLILPKEALNQPGVYYTVLKTLAWEGINVIEGISSFTELTLTFENSQVDKAFSALKKLS